MTIPQILLATALGYVAFVAVMEVVIGLVQPDMDIVVELMTTDEGGRSSSRKLAGFEFEDRLYVSSNHWLRGWYRRALAHPEIEVTIDGVPTPRVAVPVMGQERERLADAYRMGFVLRFICGFAPSKFLRLDPNAPGA